MERSRSYSGGWNSTRPHALRIATVKPVSKSFSEDDLMKASDDKRISPRVFSRFQVQDLALLKKDSLIGELEKCLEELEEKSGTTQHLSDVYQKVETERNQLLDELDIAFHDLQEYMKRQKQIEDQKDVVENDREELIKENEYLKAVLSNRTQIQSTKLEEQNKLLQTRVKELEKKNTELFDEINGLYDERQTLISSLLNLNSDDVDEVISKRSRSSSVTSRGSLDERDKLDEDVFEEKFNGLNDNNQNSQMESLKQDLAKAENVISTLKEELGDMKLDKDELEKANEIIAKALEEKKCDYSKLQEDRNEKNLGLSKLSLEKRTLQRQLDHMRESNRTYASKVTELTEENEKMFQQLETITEENDREIETKIAEAEACGDELAKKENSINELLGEKKHLEIELNELKANLSEQTSSILQNENIQTENDQLKVELEHIKHSLIDLEKKNLEAKTTLSAIMIAKDELVKERDDLESNLEQIQHELLDLKNENEHMSTERTNFKSEISVLGEQLSNQVNEFEIEQTKLTSEKQSIEKSLRKKEESERTLSQHCKQLEKSLKDKEKEVEKLKSSTNEKDEKLVTLQRRFDTVKKEHDRILQKCRQLEKSSTESEKLTSEIKRLKDSNEVLLQRYRVLQNEKETDSGIDQRTSEREKYSALLVKYDNLCKQYDYLSKQQKTINNNFDVTSTEAGNLNEQVKNFETTLNDCERKFKEISTENLNLKQKLTKNEKELVELKSKTNRASLSHIDNLQNEIKSLQNMLKTFQNEKDTLTQKINKQQNENDINRGIIHELQNEKTNTNNRMNNLQNENDNLQIRIDKLHKENSILQNKTNTLLEDIKSAKSEHERVEKDYQYIMKSHMEEAQAGHTNKQNKILQERDAIKTKYDLLRVELDKCEKEKLHYKKTIESLREENTKLHTEVQKHRLMSNSSQDLKIQHLRSENEALERNVEGLQDKLNKTNGEVKNLHDQLNRKDESLAMTIRSLKARKNELQLQVETLKHNNQQLKMNLSVNTEADVTRAVSNPNLSQAHMQSVDHTLTENLRNAHSKMAELEIENRAYCRKLQESEGLLYNLQQALARANDLAMQKSLEVSKTKRPLEKKIERLYHDNTELRRKIYFSNSKNEELSPTTSFSQSPILSRKTSEETRNVRKASVPVKIPNKNGNTDLSSFISSGNIFTYQDSRLSFDTDTSSTSVPESPRIAASKQAEDDLSEQLRELLDLTNDLTSEEGSKSFVSVESIAPPVPPPPINRPVAKSKIASLKEREIIQSSFEQNITKNYDTPDGVSNNTPEDIDELLSSLTQVAEDLERSENKPRSFEHWV